MQNCNILLRSSLLRSSKFASSSFLTTTTTINTTCWRQQQKQYFRSSTVIINNKSSNQQTINNLWSRSSNICISRFLFTSSSFSSSSSSSSPECTSDGCTFVPRSKMPPITTPVPAELAENVDHLISSAHVVIFSMDGCKFCTKAKEFLDSEKVQYREVVLDPETNGMKLYEALQKKVNRTSVPQIFVGGQHIGGCDDMLAKNEKGELLPLIRGHSFQYDLIVIGGGSGGLAASKEAASLGKKVALLDFVVPSPQGTKWGLGGTCVNVGCIPKKLMHHASLIGQELDDAHFFGWVSNDGGSSVKPLIRHDWSTLVQYVQNNIKSSNFGYRTLLRDANVNYINAHGKLVDPHTIELTHKNNKTEILTTNHVIVATGERPRYPVEVFGAREHAITSDDIFSLQYNPGKTLVIGASYVALECAGFLRGFDTDVTVMVRSIVLRGFDRQCSELVRDYMEKTEKIRFIDHSVPKKIIRLDDGDKAQLPGRLAVTYQNLDTKEEHTEEYNTVLFAIGRDPCTNQIGLEAAKVAVDKSGYIPVQNEQTNVPNIYAIGDIVQGKPQLTPVAIEAGILLARRLYANATTQCDYLNVPTTVFTPLEYGSCGYTEEQAVAKFGADNIEVYHQYFTPTEWRLNYYDRPRRPMNACYVKVITTRSVNNDPKEERLLGFHYVGPNAGEVSQFFAFPLKMRATKADLDGIIGIHPTNAELFTTLTVTKRSGKDATQKGCCG